MTDLVVASRVIVAGVARGGWEDVGGYPTVATLADVAPQAVALRVRMSRVSSR